MKKVKERGFTLVELMIVVAIIGVLAALAIYGVRKYIASSKTSEAKTVVGRMAKDAASRYAGEGMDSALLAAGASTGVTNRLCLTATPVPGAIAAVAGQKYQSDPAEWTTGQPATGPNNSNEGFACLRFSVADPQYYQYDYQCSAGTVVTAGAVNTTFDAIANGDLDGDGDQSQFKLNGEIRQVGQNIELFVAPNFDTTNENE